MTFPRDLLRFLYWIFFKPFSLRTWINQLDPAISSAATLFTRSLKPAAQPLRNVALFYIVAAPCLLGFGTALLLSQLGMHVNWLNLAFYLVIGIVMGASFSLGFCIAFILPFSVMVAIWSSASLSPALGILLSLTLGLAYGLSTQNAKWGSIAGIVYGIVIGFLTGPLGGLTIGAAFLIGYFRIFLYILEAPLAWILGRRALKGNASSLWRYQPVRWDELIWFPLPGLANHLCALKQQDKVAFQSAIHDVQESFRQKWAVEKVQSRK